MHSNLRPARRPSLRELEVLAAVVRTGKTTAAAQALAMSQSAVSRALASLETAVGRKLFDRDGGRLAPNSEALRLVSEAGPLFALLDGLAGEREPGPATLRVAAPPTIAHRFMPGLIACFMAAEPGVSVHMEIGMTETVMAAVANANADVGVSDGLVKHSGLQATPYVRAFGHVVLRADHPLAGRAQLTPPDLAGEPFIALTPRFHRRFVYDNIFADHGVARRVVAETATSIAVCELARAGVGIGVVNPFPVALRGADDGLAFVPFAPRVEYMSAFICPLGPVNPLARRFIEFARGVIPSDARVTPA